MSFQMYVTTRISEEYFVHFIKKHACDERFVRMAQALGAQGV